MPPSVGRGWGGGRCGSVADLGEHVASVAELGKHGLELLLHRHDVLRRPEPRVPRELGAHGGVRNVHLLPQYNIASRFCCAHELSGTNARGIREFDLSVAEPDSKSSDLVLSVEYKLPPDSEG